jgi:RNA polymerase-binding protein DksA
MKKAKTAQLGLTPEDVQKFRAVLLAKRSEILGNVTNMGDETFRRVRSDLSSMPPDVADLGSDNYDLENTLGLMESETKILLEIDHALRRIEEGTYGICEVGGEPIVKERLEAIPWARCCVACASLSEKRGAANRRNVAWPIRTLPVTDDEEEDDALDEPVGRQKI